LRERQFPGARVDCLSRQLDDEVVIYDPKRHQGHCLNSTAAAVWKLCDGKHSPLQIAEALSRQLSVRVDQQVVALALERLADARLLAEPEASVESPSRRVALRRIGVAAAIALPLITSIVAPTPANAAATCLHNGAPCTTAAQCCSGICLGTCITGGTRSRQTKRSSKVGARFASRDK
jgi:hypothetical protein